MCLTWKGDWTDISTSTAHSREMYGHRDKP